MSIAMLGENRIRVPRLSIIAVLLALAPAAFAQQGVEQLEQQALFAAASELAPSVVRIETIGGLEKVGQLLVTAGPTSGIVVAADGYVISSAYNFIQEPNSILVQLPNGERKAAKIVSRDHSRRLVLLKVQVDEPLVVPRAAPKHGIRVGQWAVTVGRTLPGEHFNMSVGIISAKNRIWSTAVQTDANVSPANYGGALVDIQGRVIGVLVPLSPDSNEVVAGAEWYDSGIGFAIPFEDILGRLSELKAGDLLPGKLGIAIKGSDMYGAAPTIGVCRPKSPAREAGLKAGDIIVGVDGKPVRRHVELRHLLGPRLAGEIVTIELQRDGERLTKEVELTDKLVPYEHAFLGILPVRENSTVQAPGVLVRHVYRESPAATAGLVEGDRIVEFNGQAVQRSGSLRELLAAMEPGQEVGLKFSNGETSEAATVKLARLPEAIPHELPPPLPQVEAYNEDLPQLGKINIKLPEEAGECVAYVPESYDPRFSHALLVLLPVPSKQQADKLIGSWRQALEDANTIMLMPQAKDPRSWLPTETAFIRKTIENLRTIYNVDPERIVVHGSENSGAMAFLTGFTHRDLIRGIAATNAPIPRRAPSIFNEPLQRLAIYLGAAKEGRRATQIKANIKQLRESKFPVTEHEAEQGHEFDNDDRQTLLRWIDTLDRI